MKQNLRRLLKKIYKFCFKPFFKNGIDVNIGGTGKFRFDYIFAFSKFDIFGTKHNSGFSKWLKACKGKKTIFDIGAHIGLYSIPASQIIDKKGAIYAFEPSNANRSYLERHMYFNKVENVSVFPYLVGEEPLGAVEFYENRDVDAMNSVMIRKNPNLYNKISKRQVSLDEFCTSNKITPEVVKIDVEGAEIGVLKGAKGIFGRCRPIIFLSIHPRTLALLNQSVEELIWLIDKMDYVIYDKDGQRMEPFEHNEYILVPKERHINEYFKKSL